MLRLVALQAHAGNVSGGHLALFLGAIMCGRIQRRLSSLDTAFRSGFVGPRVGVVKYHEQLSSRNLVAGLDVDRFHSGGDGAVKLIVHLRLNLAVGAYRVQQHFAINARFAHRQLVPKQVAREEEHEDEDQRQTSP